MAKKKLKWSTETRKVSDLVPYENNPRTLSKRQADQLERSLEKFDLVELPVINTDDKLIAGHQRVAILIALGRGGETIEVRVPNRKLTDAEFKEYNIRSNANTADWDYDELANTFEELDLVAWGLDVLLPVEKQADQKDKEDRGEKVSSKRMVTCPACGHEHEVTKS